MRSAPSPRSLRRIAMVSGASCLLIGVAAYSTFRFWPEVAIHRYLPQTPLVKNIESWFEPSIVRVTITDPVARKIVASAHKQEGNTYNASYQVISYPNGDVPAGSGACTDVVVRALRSAGIDLQKLVHEDMARDFERYPDSWHLGHPDANIDHRRVPNLMVFFRKNGLSLPLGITGADLKTWLPGDIVCWKAKRGPWHTGIVSDGIGPSGKPTVIHNPFVCIEQDKLDFGPIAGHFRVSPQKLNGAQNPTRERGPLRGLSTEASFLLGNSKALAHASGSML